jgi:pyruvate/2-oxoacid:ferredoxin oxidoreductase alpha subunit
MMEPLALPEPSGPPPPKPWALTAEASSNQNVITSIYLDPEEMETHVLHLQEKYGTIEESESRCEQYRTEDAELILTGFGIVSRILQTAVDLGRAEGLKIGLFRPQTLWPFPTRELLDLTQRVKNFLVVEINNGQMVHDIRLIVEGRCPVYFQNRVGGFVPSPEDVVKKARRIMKGSAEC